jgi:hypothetical protein
MATKRDNRITLVILEAAPDGNKNAGRGARVILTRRANQRGRLATPLSSPVYKNIPVFAEPKSLPYSLLSRPERGATRDRHGRGAGCGGRRRRN